jgi:hypothetical protein
MVFSCFLRYIWKLYQLRCYKIVNVHKYIILHATFIHGLIKYESLNYQISIRPAAIVSRNGSFLQVRNLVHNLKRAHDIILITVADN